MYIVQIASECADQFRELVFQGMSYDYSGNHPGKDYLEIYEHIRHK